MNFNRNINQTIEKFFLVTSFFGLIYVLLFNEDSNYINLYFLPLSYFIFFAVLFLSNKQRKTTQYRSGVAYIAAITAIFIRYVITPMTMIYTGNYSGIGVDPNKSSLDFAILLMINELLMIMITMNFAIFFYHSHKGINENSKDSILKSELQRIPLNVTLIIFTALSVLLIIILNYRLLLPLDMFLIDSNFTPLSLEVELSGGIYVLANLIKTILLLICLSFLKYKYDKKQMSRYIFLSFAVLILYMGMMTSTKRWDMLFAAILCLFLLNHSYKKIPKYIIISVISFMLMSLISISAYKFSWYIRDSINPMHDIISFLLEGFQAYFSGPRNVAHAIEMKEIFGSRITLVTFINDFLGSVPILSNWINQSDRINTYFNLYNNLSNSSQIIPMVGIGYCYIPLLSPVFSMICEWYVIKMDYCIQKTNRIEFKFIYFNLALYLAMSMGFNTQIIFAFFITKFIPLYILFSLNRKIVLRAKLKSSYGGFSDGM